MKRLLAPIVVSILSMFILAFSATLAHAADERIALVVGEQNYPRSPLRNTLADAKLVGDALRSSGFSVETAENVDFENLKTALRAFYKKAKKVSGNSIAIVYYAGHGAYWEKNNYLIPVGTEVEGNVASLFRKSIMVSEIVSELGSTNIKHIAVFADACRKNSFVGADSPLTNDTLNQEGGQQILIGYATAVQSFASDGAGNNGPYAISLAKQLSAAGVTLSEQLARVSVDVSKASNRKQVPYVVGSSDFVLNQTSFFSFAQLSDTNGSGPFGQNAKDRSRPTVTSTPIVSWTSNNTPSVQKFYEEWSTAVSAQQTYVPDLQLTEKLLAESAKGDGKASLLLAEIYAGDFDPRILNYEKYIKFIALAISRQAPVAIYRHARFLCCDKAGPHDLPHSVAWLEAGEAANEPLPISLLGEFYRDGKGVVRDVDKAAILYERSAGLGIHSDWANLAQLYRFAEYGRQDFAKAKFYYEKALDSGESHFAVDYGRMVRWGIKADGSDANPADALDIFYRGTEAGCKKCWTEIGRLLLSSQTGNVSAESVADAFERGDAARDLASSFRLAGMTMRGEGRKKDPILAYQLVAKAAAGDSRVAKMVVSENMIEGIGTKRNPADAAKLIRSFLLGPEGEHDPVVDLTLMPLASWNKGNLLASLIEDKKAPPLDPNEAARLRSRYGPRNAQPWYFKTEVDCLEGKKIFTFPLIDWERPNDETPLDVGSDFERWNNQCAVPKTKLEEIRAIQQQARETHVSFVKLVAEKYPPAPAVPINPPK